MATKNFAALVQSLPQELYDEIYDLTFTADDEPRVINKDYKPPHLLYVDRASRTKYVKSYYGNGTFMLPPAFGQTWARSVPATHFDMICNFNLNPDTYKRVHWGRAMDCWEEILEAPGYEIVRVETDGISEIKGFTVRDKEGKSAWWKMECSPSPGMVLTKICEAAL